MKLTGAIRRVTPTRLATLLTVVLAVAGALTTGSVRVALLMAAAICGSTVLYALVVRFFLGTPEEWAPDEEPQPTRPAREKQDRPPRPAGRAEVTVCILADPGTGRRLQRVLARAVREQLGDAGTCHRAGVAGRVHRCVASGRSTAQLVRACRTAADQVGLPPGSYLMVREPDEAPRKRRRVPL